MKKVFLVTTAMMIITAGMAQVKKSSSISSKSSNKSASAVNRKSAVNSGAKPVSGGGTSRNSSYSSTSSNAAKAPSAEPLTIKDPTILALNDQANGGGITVSKSGIVGMPKRYYGFANGRLMLRSTNSTTSGTITGNGSVSSGSSLGNIGSSGAGIGLNGKSPYAGSTMWGNATGMTLNYGDSSVRVNRH